MKFKQWLREYQNMSYAEYKESFQEIIIDGINCSRGMKGR